MKKLMSSSGTILTPVPCNKDDEVIILDSRPDISKDVKRTADNTERTADGVDKLYVELAALSSDLEAERVVRAKADKKNQRIALTALGVSIFSALVAFIALVLPYLLQ